MSAREANFIVTGHFNQHLVREVKNSHNSRNTSAADRFLRDVIAPNVLKFSKVKRVIAKESGATDYGSQHSPVTDRIDILRLVNDMLSREVSSRKDEIVRLATEPFAVSKSNDSYTTGWSKLKLAIGIGEMLKKRETGYYELHDVLEVNDRAICHCDDDSDGDS